MPDVTITPNMNIPVPVPSVAPGPEWANSIVADMSVIDSHDHSAGKGVQVTPDGLDINADLPIGENNLTEVRTVRFTSQSAALSDPTDLGCLYEVNADLYYNDGAGNQVRITQSGTVTGSTGTITGLPSGTASAAYSAGTFTFQSATSTPATMAVGPVAIGRQVASSKTVTLTPNAGQASNYDITFPAALPAADNYTTLDNTGALSYNSSGSTGSGAVVLATAPTITNLTAIAAAGSAAAPSYSFTGDTNTGFYNPGANEIGVTNDGSRRFTFSTDHLVSTFAGSAVAPVYQCDSAGAGIYAYTSTALGIAAGGSNAAIFTSTATIIPGALQAASLQTSSGGAFKVKVITIGSSSATGGSVSAAHGLSMSNIVAILGSFRTSSNVFGPSTMGSAPLTSNTVDYTADSTNVQAAFSGTGATTKVFTAVIFYQ